MKLKKSLGGNEMNISIQNDIKVIEMGDKGPNLLSVDRADKIISELSKNCLLYTSDAADD